MLVYKGHANYVLTDKEKENLVGTLEWYREHMFVLRDSGIDIDKDLYDIIKEVLEYSI